MASYFRQGLARSRLNFNKIRIQQSDQTNCGSNVLQSIHRCMSTSIKSKHGDTSSQFADRLSNGPALKHFLVGAQNEANPNENNAVNLIPYIDESDYDGRGRKVFLEVYGCQMNVNDTEIVWSILKDKGYVKTNTLAGADVALLMTCSIREKAENKIWARLKELSKQKRQHRRLGKNFQIGILGCMAERLKTDLLEKEKSVDIIGGPDSYKDLPRLLYVAESGQSAVNVLLSLDETYADVMPVRMNENSVTAFVSIMRGCDNMCTYCIVPFTRGRERSRPIDTIEVEAKVLAEQGVKEITLLGQNVNSYRDMSDKSTNYSETSLASGFKTVYKSKKGGLRFAELLERVAGAVPEVRIRFTSPHPKDFPDEVLHVMEKYSNICQNIHLPLQAGNNNVLERMRRGYTKESYLELVDHIRSIMPGIGLSSDFIAGFCGETEDEFAETLSVMETVKYNMAYMFAYSMREKTTAHRRFEDTLSQEVKNRRVGEMSKLFYENAKGLNAACIGKTQLILIEGESKKSSEQLFGRNDANTKVIIPANVKLPMSYREMKSPSEACQTRTAQPGDFIAVQITQASSVTLHANPLHHTTIADFNIYKDA